MEIKKSDEEKPVSPNPWGSLEKTAVQNGGLPSLPVNDEKEDDALNGGQTVEADVDKRDFHHLDNPSVIAADEKEK